MQRRSVSSIPWGSFSHLQVESREAVIDPRTYGYDEALDELLSRWIIGRITPDNEVEKHFEILRANRTAKYRYRAALERRNGLWSGDSFRDPGEELGWRELVRELLKVLRPEELELLSELAAGLSYEEVAVSRGEPVGTVKARASRYRKRVRDSAMGKRIHRAMNGSAYESP